MDNSNTEKKKRASNNEANQLTRLSICTALLELMEKKSIDEISVTELVKRAGVSRQSFYRNYDSKEDIIIEIEETILATVKETLSDPKYDGDLRLWLLDLFKTVKENATLIKVLKRTSISDVLFYKVPFIVEDIIGESSTKTHYHIVGSLAALRKIILEWVFSGMKESCETMADLCLVYDPARLR